MFRTFISPRRAGTLTVAAALLTASLASAQTAPPPPATVASADAELSRSAVFTSLLPARGKDVWVTTTDGQRRRSRIVALAPGSVTLADNVIREVAFDHINKVENDEHSSGRRLAVGGLIGFGSGFGFMAAILASCWDDECEPNLAPAIAMGGLGAGIGLGIGALRNLHHSPHAVIYERRSTTTFNVAPILSPTRKGVAFSMTWR